jgi:hypothetical protein
MIVVGDEVADLLLEITGQVVVLEQNAVLERLVPALDLALCLGMQWGTTDMVHALLLEPVYLLLGRMVLPGGPADVLHYLLGRRPRLGSLSHLRFS